MKSIKIPNELHQELKLEAVNKKVSLQSIVINKLCIKHPISNE